MSDQELNGTQPENTPALEGEPQEANERTFTQDEINRIISRRVAEERAKAEALLAKREAEIVQREYEYHVQSVLRDKNLPPRLLDALKGGDKATFDNSIAVIEELMDQPFKEAVQAAVVQRLRGSGAPSDAVSRAPSLPYVIREAMGLDRKE